MKKSKYSLTVTAAVVAAALGGCRFAGQEVQDVYGPPIESLQEAVQEVYGPPIEEEQ